MGTFINAVGFLFEESQTADEAHKRNLTYKGHGYWENAQGQTVAKTENGKLIDLSPEEFKIQNPNFSKSDSQSISTSAPSTVSGIHTPTDTISSVFPQSSLELFKIDPSSFYMQLDKIDPSFIKHGMFDETNKLLEENFKNFMIPIDGEETYIISDDTTSGEYALQAFDASDLERVVPWDTVTNFSTEESKKQANKYEATLSIMDKLQLASARYFHTDDGSYNLPRYIKAFHNKVFNYLLKFRPQIDMSKSKYVPERGISLNPESVLPFLSNFKKDHSMTLPISGFSAKPYISRLLAFSSPGHLPILLQLHPTENKKLTALFAAPNNNKVSNIEKTPEFMEIMRSITTQSDMVNKQLKSNPENSILEQKLSVLESMRNFTPSMVQQNASYNNNYTAISDYVAEEELVTGGNHIKYTTNYIKKVLLISGGHKKRATPLYIIGLKENE